jgi:RNA polymerase sigma-70 factor (ECF subfamily)
MPARPDEPTPGVPSRAAVLEEALTHMDALYRTALRMTGEPADAEDLVQDTYLKVTRSAHRYREGAGVRAWLFRILTNAYIDRYRRRQRAPDTIELTESGGLYNLFLESLSGGDPPAAAARGWTEPELRAFLRNVVGDEVKAALESLPPAFRIAVILRDVEGFSYREIADMLGVPVGTVMSRIFRGRKALQERLAAYARTHGYGAG